MHLSLKYASVQREEAETVGLLHPSLQIAAAHRGVKVTPALTKENSDDFLIIYFSLLTLYSQENTSTYLLELSAICNQTHFFYSLDKVIKQQPSENRSDTVRVYIMFLKGNNCGGKSVLKLFK